MLRTISLHKLYICIIYTYNKNEGRIFTLMCICLFFSKVMPAKPHSCKSLTVSLIHINGVAWACSMTTMNSRPAPIGWLWATRPAWRTGFRCTTGASEPTMKVCHFFVVLIFFFGWNIFFWVQYFFLGTTIFFIEHIFFNWLSLFFPVLLNWI